MPHRVFLGKRYPSACGRWLLTWDDGNVSPSVDRRAAVIVNPIARSADDELAALQAVAAKLDIDLRVMMTTIGHPGRTQARQAVDKGFDSVVAVGGDGTLRQVAAGVAHTDVALGIMPAGAGNIVARNVGLRPGDHARNAEVALTGRPRPVDLAWATIDDEAREPFLGMIGMGRDAEVVAAVTRRSKQVRSWRAYARAGLKALRATPLPFIIDGAHENYWTVLVGNAPRVPMGARVFPDVHLDSGDLQVLRVERPSLLNWAGIAAFGLGLRRKAPRLRWSRVTSVAVSFPSPRAVQIDGDVVASASTVFVDVDASALLVRSPA